MSNSRIERDTDPAPPPTTEWVDVDLSDLDCGSGDTGIGTGRIQVVEPDSHGYYVDPKAYAAFLGDLKILRPKRLIKLGDHVDAGGTFSSHAGSFFHELDYSYEADCAAANAQLDEEQKYCEEVVYIAGNHENRLERWCLTNIGNRKDAELAAGFLAPDKMLKLKERGVRYVRSDRTYDGLSVPGTVRYGKCHYQHGYSIAKHAAAAHLADFNECIVFGHVHRVQEYRSRTIRSEAIGAWTPGCLSQLQPFWQHNKPTIWAQGYGLQFFDRSGRFLHLNVPIVNGWSGLGALLRAIRPAHLMGEAA